MRIYEMLEEIDDFLQSQEDYLDGQDGKDCSRCRTHIHKIKRDLPSYFRFALSSEESTKEDNKIILATATGFNFDNKGS